MSENHCLIWNARGLNSRARRSVVRNLVSQHGISILCLQETKVANFSVSMINDIMGSDFDYLCLPVIGAAGGVLIAWRSDLWDASLPSTGTSR
jgi:exonuclease III